MKITDINTSIGVARSRRFRDARGLIGMMDKSRIENALVFNYETLRAPREGNRAAYSAASESGGRLLFTALVNPSLAEQSIDGEGDLASRLSVVKPVAVRLCPDDNSFILDSFYAGDILEPLERLHMPVIIDSEYSEAFLSYFPRTAVEFPNIPFIFLRFGFNKSRYVMPMLKKLQNVYFDMSTMLDTGQLEEICEKHGSERLLFGSGMPDYEPSGALGLLYYAEIAESDRENIAHANFDRLREGIIYE